MNYTQNIDQFPSGIDIPTQLTDYPGHMPRQFPSPGATWSGSSSSSSSPSHSDYSSYADQIEQHIAYGTTNMGTTFMEPNYSQGIYNQYHQPSAMPDLSQNTYVPYINGTFHTGHPLDMEDTAPCFSDDPIGSITSLSYVDDNNFPDEPTDAQTEAYLYETLSIPTHMPLNLQSLHHICGDKNPKISSLIKLAIWGSPGHKLTLQGIYRAVEQEFESHRTQEDKAWRRSIRHNLSLKAMFTRMDRPINHPGKGYYWKINVNMGDGNKRDRRRTRDRKGDEQDSHIKSEDEYDSSSDVATESYSRQSYRSSSHPGPQYLAPNPGMDNVYNSPPSIMPRANMLFAQPGHGMMGMPSSGPQQLYPQNAHMFGNGVPTHNGQGMQDLLRGPGSLAMGGYNAPRMDAGAAQRRMVGAPMPARQHQGGVYHQQPPMSMGGMHASTQAPSRHRRPHSETSSDDSEEMDRGAPRMRYGNH